MRSPLSRWPVLACFLLTTAAWNPWPAAADYPPKPAAPAPAPTLAELRNMEYSGFADDPGPIQLVDGRYEGAPYVPGAPVRRTVTFGRDFRLTGDLDGDGQDEAIVVLAENKGGSGTFDYLAVVGRRRGKPVDLATAPLGDRVQIRDARIEGRRLVVDVLRAGPEDAMCCPGELATVAWEMKGGRLETVPTGIAPQRLTLAAIAGVDWVLRSWSWDEPVPKGLEITLRLEGDQVTGRAACNRYFATVTPGQSLGELAIGPAGSTKMACPEPQMAAESRFLAQLAGARSFSFLLGELALGWSQEGRGGAMLFARRRAP